MIDPHSLVKQLGHPKILVLGDAMLDRYTWGHAERVSPEAPVLVLRADQREVRLGGAASVAMLLRAFEAEVTLVTVVGDDHDGRTVRRLLDESGIDAGSVLMDPSRPTTVKERFLGHSVHKQPHQMLRVDTESREPISDPLREKLILSLTDQIPTHAAVLISDYAKGICTESFLTAVISTCREFGVPVLVDPGRGVDFGIYRGASLIKPNRSEAESAFFQKIVTVDDGLQATKALRQGLGIDTVVITLDRDGLVFADHARADHLPIAPRSLTDITGAGDTVLAALGLGIASGLPIQDAASLANIAAGLQVQQPGVTPITRKELLREWSKQNRPKFEPLPDQSNSLSKRISLDRAQQLAEEYRQAGHRIVFTNGCFDLLHVGHISMLEECATHGDILFVATNSDASIRRLKGDGRPIVPEDDRALMLSSLNCVDHVLIFEEDTPHRLLQAIRPDVLIKGGTSTSIVGRELVESYGGQVIRTGTVEGKSTTRLLAQIQSH